MSAAVLFYILIGIIVSNYLIDIILDSLNASHYDNEVPEVLADVYDNEKYQQSLEYKKTNFKFSLVSSTLSVVLTLAFFFLDGFQFVDNLARSYTSNSTLIALLSFGIIMFASELVSLPLAYYKTFVIEEQFGFNKSTLTTFILDKLKGWFMLAAIGGGLLALIIWLYEASGSYFWLFTWGVITLFSVFINLFYTKLIVPLFNKQTPLEEGPLKEAIEAYALKVRFSLPQISVIDGSKRSTKANAYFSGFGSQKRITLYDTLIHDLTIDEIVAVLAHEVGHYKKKHVYFNLIASILITGITLYILSLCINAPLLSEALNVSSPSFHIGLITFGILYTPISAITGFLMGLLSRRFEYQADRFAKETFNGDALIEALKKLSKNSLTNLTPHPWYVAIQYSHPTLLQRLQSIQL